MTKRIKISGGTPPVFKMAKPGFDVDTAAADDMAFDISLGKMSGVYMSGIITESMLTTNGTDDRGTIMREYWVDYGKEFAIPPQFILHSITGTGSTSFVTPNYSRYMNNAPDSRYLRGYAFTDKLLIRMAVRILSTTRITYCILQV